MPINPIYQNQNTSFKAKLQLSGNASLLKNEQALALRTIVDKIGSKTDIVDINLSKEMMTKGLIPIAVFANNKLSQFLGEFKNDEVYSGIINALEQTKEFFPEIATIITSSLVTKKAEEVEKNTIIDSLEKNSKPETLTNKNQNNNLETINTKINEFMDYMNNRRYDSIEESFILMAMRNSIQNDSFLQNEYSTRLQQKTYSIWNPYSEEYENKKYTGNNVKDYILKDEYNDCWFKDSTETIYEILQDNDLKEKVAQTTIQILDKNKVLENFSIEELESYHEKLNEKFRNFISLCNYDYTGRNYIILEHPITDCIWNSVSNDSDLSEYLKKEVKENTWYKLDKLQKAYAVSEALNNDVFKSQILAQLLLNSPTQISYEKQKEILDKIAQSTIRDTTPEEDGKVRNGEAHYYFYNA